MFSFYELIGLPVPSASLDRVPHEQITLSTNTSRSGKPKLRSAASRL